MQFLRVTVLLALLLVAAAAYPQTPSYKCGTHKEVVLKNFAEGYAFTATAITDRGLVIQLFINLNTGEFRFIGVDDDGNSCVTLAGYEWAFVLVQGI